MFICCNKTKAIGNLNYRTNKQHLLTIFVMVKLILMDLHGRGMAEHLNITHVTGLLIFPKSCSVV